MCDSFMMVVLYDKSMDESTTLLSLCDFYFSEMNLVIHNNGPTDISPDTNVMEGLEHAFKSVTLVNCSENLPLSYIYNDFIESNSNASKFILLDDDTTVTLSFSEALSDNSCDIILPRIISKSDGVVYYPISNGIVVTDDCKLNPAVSFSIGSGLIINSSLVEKFKRSNIKLFDERFSLYGVDVSLFRQMSCLVKKGVPFSMKSSAYLKHSLSRTEGIESSFRMKERLLDISISARRYPSISLYYNFIKKMVKHLMLGDFSTFNMMLKAYVFGRHPKCKIRRY